MVLGPVVGSVFLSSGIVCLIAKRWGRKNYEPLFFAREGEQVGTAAVKGGRLKSIPLLVSRDLQAVVPRRVRSAEREIRLAGALHAPVLERAGSRSRPTQIIECWAANTAICNKVLSLSPHRQPELVKPAAADAAARSIADRLRKRFTFRPRGDT